MNDDQFFIPPIVWMWRWAIVNVCLQDLGKASAQINSLHVPGGILYEISVLSHRLSLGFTTTLGATLSQETTHPVN